MLVPGDLLTDADLTALDSTLEDLFGPDVYTTLRAKRRVAVMDWLGPQLEGARYRPDDHRVRHAPTLAYQVTGGVYTDVTTACSDETAEDLDLSAVWTTPANDALYIGYTRPFLGLFVGLTGATVSATTAAVSVAIWNGSAWAGVPSFIDSTQATSGKAFSRGGRLAWTAPEDWVPRFVDESDLLFWAKVTVSAALTSGTAVDQVLPIVRSRLTYPVSLYCLSLLYRDAQAGRRGQYLEQANDYQAQAVAQLSSVLPLISDEFDTDATGAVSTSDDVAGAPLGRVVTMGRA